MSIIKYDSIFFVTGFSE
jgi:hypothetical protein